MTDRVKDVAPKEAEIMAFELPSYRKPELNRAPLASCPDAVLMPVVTPGVAPAGFHATTIYPEYIKISGEWALLSESRMDCVVTVTGGVPEVKEFRRLEQGELVVVGRAEDGSEGIYVHAWGFERLDGNDEAFSFRTGRTRATSYSMDYDRLYDLLEYERENGHVVWVLGPAVVFDYDSRKAMEGLIANGFVDAVFSGNALPTHDLEGAMFRTALGQDIYTQNRAANGHYNHLDVINMARAEGSLEAFIDSRAIADGIVWACAKKDVPLVIAGSIRDDGPVPGAIADVYAAQDAMRERARRARRSSAWPPSSTRSPPET